MNNQKQNRLFTLTLSEGLEPGYLNTVATLVRGLPEVLRVRVDAKQGQLEILHRQANHELLQQIHLTLLTANSQLGVARVR